MIRVIILGLLLSAYAYSQYDEKEGSRDVPGENAGTSSQPQFLTPDVVPSAVTSGVTSTAPDKAAVTEVLTVEIPATELPAAESADAGNADINTDESTAQQIQSPLFSNTGSPAKEITAKHTECMQIGSTASCLI